MSENKRMTDLYLKLYRNDKHIACGRLSVENGKLIFSAWTPDGMGMLNECPEPFDDFEIIDNPDGYGRQTVDTDTGGAKVTFEMSDEEVRRFEDWDAKHKCNLKKYSGAIGGRLTFSFTPTSLGTLCCVECGCGEHIDVTDVSEW